MPQSVLAPVLADCKEEERMREVLTEERPSIIFHAAAYKHVGLMERNPVEAVRNNAIGTRVVATVAGQLSLDAFVLVSTDKAVMPATVMGASKALAECAIDAAQRRFPATRYMAVRFGNVLGSSGSVVPIFRRQIEAGGPVTVTDPEMTRYFMTIPEAVALVIRAGSLGEGGEVFVLDMGEPLSIMDLATKMIELSGLEPGRDIAIQVIGKRPGEKLHEDLFNPFEHARPTAAEKILLAQRDPMDGERVEAIAALLHDAAEDHGGERQLAEIERRFGESVAQIVRDCSDALVEEGAPKGPWLPRKQRYVAHLAEIAAQRPSSALVSAADKLYNLRSIDADLQRPDVGENVYARFSGKRWGTLWYYCALADVFGRVRGRHEGIARELRALTDRLCDKHDTAALLERCEWELDPKHGKAS